MQTATIKQRQNFWTGITFTILGASVRSGLCQCSQQHSRKLVICDLVHQDEQNNWQRNHTPFTIDVAIIKRYSHLATFIPYLGYTKLNTYLSKEYLHRYKSLVYCTKTQVLVAFWENHNNKYFGSMTSELIELIDIKTGKNYANWDFIPSWLGNPKHLSITVFERQLADLLNCKLG